MQEPYVEGSKDPPQPRAMAACSRTAATAQQWSSGPTCFNHSGWQATGGGGLGFAGGCLLSIDDLTLDGWDAAANDWKTQLVEKFTVNANGYAEHRPAYDPAGNCVFDGLYRFGYDAWNRLGTVHRAWRDDAGDGGALHSGSLIATMQYDGLHRRTSKAITNSGDWSNGATGMTYRYTWDESWLSPGRSKPARGGRVRTGQ